MQGRSRKEEGLCVRQLQGRSRKEEGLCVRQLQADPEKKKASVCDSYTRPIPKRRRPLCATAIQGRSRKAEEGDSYKADPEKKKASVRDSYKADLEKKKASVCDSYKPIPKRRRPLCATATCTVHVLRTQWGLQLCMNLIAVARVEHNDCNHILLPYSYSLYEPQSHALMEYNGGLEKAILRDSELLSEVNYAFCISSIASSKGCYKICPCSSK